MASAHVTPTASIGLRLGLAVLGGVLLGTLLLSLRGSPFDDFGRSLAGTRRRTFLVSAALVVLRQAAWVDREPLGFWPRWLYVWGLHLYGPWPCCDWAHPRRGPATGCGDLHDARAFTGLGWMWRDAVSSGASGPCVDTTPRSSQGRSTSMTLATDLPRPRPGHDRHHFKTIINLFPEYPTDEEVPCFRRNWPSSATTG